MSDEHDDKDSIIMATLPRDQWDKGHPDTLTSRVEIGRELGVSPERVRQIEERALSKLAAHLCIEKGILEKVLTSYTEKGA